jgi:tRNA threonylcarbamoyladenosine biosynthesis protein TsaB
MYIIHIETSTKICSVALSRDDQVLDTLDREDQMNHTALLSPMVELLLRQNHLSVRDLGAVSVSSGPGSYTGLRVGGSTAKAMSYSLGIPLISVPTLEALSSAAFQLNGSASHALPMIDARRDEVYTTLYDREWRMLWPVQSMLINSQFHEVNLADFERVICCGDGAFKTKPFLAGRPNLVLEEGLVCRAAHLVKPAWKRWEQNAVADPLHYVPEYLKPPNITQPRNPG